VLIESREQRDVVFIRHGESLWNVVFNGSKNPIFFIGRLVKSAAVEVGLMMGNSGESQFYDSALSGLGLTQAVSLKGHLESEIGKTESDKHAFFHRLLRGDTKEAALLVSSNLRRALTTAALVLQNRLTKNEEQIVLHPALQEISGNPDALSAMPPFASPPLSMFEKSTPHGPYLAKIYSKQLDASLNSGNKAAASNGRDRIVQFASWLFTQPRTGVVAVGHSLWFRSFFREYLPANVSHPAKEKKITNGGAVGFSLEKITLKNKQVIYRIMHESVTLVYGGYK
jgi:broad specificity phosphatase PhoE